MTLTNFLKNKDNLILVSIIILAIFLIFFRLTRADIQTDGAHYSLRAIGYLDFLLSQLQTTPIQWFGAVPWWGKLSFHDHPPLVFLIQHLFFKVLGVSDFIALLPFALAGVGSVILIYFIGKRFGGEKVGLLAVLLLTVSTYFIWAARINFLEGIVIFFIILTIFSYQKFLNNQKWFWFFGISLGLMLLTKYSAFFLLPVLICHLLFKHRQFFKDYRTYLALLIALIIFSPVITYNLIMYQTRGHFDIQLSSIFPFARREAAKDWPILMKGDTELNPWLNFSSLWSILKIGYSWPFYCLILFSSVWLVINFAAKFKDRPNLLLVLSFIFLSVFFTLTGPTPRYLSIFSPFFALSGALFIVKLYEYLKIKNNLRFLKLFFVIVFIAILAGELFYNVNTNHFNQKVGKVDLFYSNLRGENDGFKQLEKFISSTFNFDPFYNPNIMVAKKTSDLRMFFEKVKGRNFYLYGSSLNWFSVAWYFHRYLLYNKVYIASDYDILLVLGYKQGWFNFFQKLGVKDFYFIKGIGDLVYGANIDSDRQELSQKIEAEIVKALAEGAPGEVYEIRNNLDQLAFKVYKLKLNGI